MYWKNTEREREREINTWWKEVILEEEDTTGEKN